MRVLIQRVSSCRVEWEGGETGAMGRGLLCLVGFSRRDGPGGIEPMADKLVHLRILDDPEGRMNRSLVDTGGCLVLVPQFTLYADCRKGRRPGFSTALAPEEAEGLFSRFEAACRTRVDQVAGGKFGAHMQVHLVNDGPVTILLDSDELNLTPASGN